MTDANRAGRVRRVRQIFLCATTCVAIGGVDSSRAQEARQLEIEINGEMTPDLRRALARVFQPNSLDAAININAEARPAIDFCVAFDACPLVSAVETPDGLTSKLADEILATAASRGEAPDKAGNGQNLAAVVQKKKGPIPFLSGVQATTFVILPGTSPSLKGLVPDIDGATAFAVRLEPKVMSRAERDKTILQVGEPNEAIYGDLAAVWFSDKPSRELDLLTKDIDRLGWSSRGIPLPPNVDKEAIKDLFETAAKHDGVSIAIDESFDSQIWPVQDLTFAGSPADCAALSGEWPFNVARIKSLIDSNLLILDRMGVESPRKARIFVLDTGVGESLLRNKGFAKRVSINLDHLLYANYYYPRENSFEVKDRVCTIADEHASAFGFSVDDAGSASCRTSTGFKRVLPIPRSDLSAIYANDNLYSPAHGSVVSVLTLGGPHFYSAEEIDRLLSMNIGRMTRISEAEGEKHLRTDVSDVGFALEYAASHDIDVINASFSVQRNDTFNKINNLKPAFSKFQGILIAAAGNKGAPLSATGLAFPATRSDLFDSAEQLIVVAALDRDAQGDIVLWRHSNESDTYIDIGAPGAGIPSLDDNVDPVCVSGTSAAAPFVSFASAMLHAYGIRSAGEIKHRILSTANHSDALKTKIKDGRILNLHAALDVFSDLIWKDGETEPVRGVIFRDDQDATKPVMLQLCHRDASVLRESRGFIDIAALKSWLRQGQQAKVIHRINTGGVFDLPCDAPASAIHFRNFETGEAGPILLSRIDRIVPSPFRNAMAVAADPH